MQKPELIRSRHKNKKEALISILIFKKRRAKVISKKWKLNYLRKITDCVLAENLLVDGYIFSLSRLLFFLWWRFSLLCFVLLNHIFCILLFRNNHLLLFFFRNLASSRLNSVCSLDHWYSHWLRHSRVICAVLLLRELLLSRAAGSKNRRHNCSVLN